MAEIEDTVEQEAADKRAAARKLAAEQAELAANARAVFEEEIAKGTPSAEEAAKLAAEKREAAARADSIAKVEEQYADRGFTVEKRSKGAPAKVSAPEPIDPTSKQREAAEKEASVPGSDPRDSVFDAAPGKSFDDVVERNAARAAGEFSDAPAEPKPVQHFIVTDEPSLIEVAAKLGLHDHAALGVLNGRYSSVYGVQPGERVVLPAEYDFTGIEGVVTAGEESEELAGAEATA